jgi:tetratricopeptide (TPR) repeat protein
MTRPQEPRRRRRTQFRVPPPLTQRVGATGFPGLDLLEHEAPPAGVVIWRCFRDVELWARTPHRAGLFAGGGAEERARDVEALDADAYGGALPPLRVLAGVAACPERAVPEEVAGACARLAGWFEGQGRLRSAIEFAQAASFVEPGRAIPAVRVGRLARMLAEYPRAIGWFDHAIYLARRSSDWQAYAEALAGLGILYAQLGNLPRARAYHARCLRVSRRSHLREMAGAAYHNLFTLETDAGNYELAEAHVARAFQAYPATAPGLPRLARDVAWQWTVMGYFARALPLAMEALHHFSGAVERALVWANIARAAGGAGEGDVFEDAWGGDVVPCEPGCDGAVRGGHHAGPCARCGITARDGARGTGGRQGSGSGPASQGRKDVAGSGGAAGFASSWGRRSAYRTLPCRGSAERSAAWGRDGSCAPAGAGGSHVRSCRPLRK